MMTNDLGDRQRGDLGGRLYPPLQPAAITIGVSGAVARSRSGQHLLWMITNLLARQADEVTQLTVELSRDITVLPGISPLLCTEGGLVDALNSAAQRINPNVTVHHAFTPTLRLQIGTPEGHEDACMPTLYVSATSWCGYVGSEAVPWGATLDDNPIGPYVAACLGAAEAFKIIRGVQEDYGSLPSGVWYDAYHLTTSPLGNPGPALLEHIQGQPAVLAGVGAVGTALLHTLYAIPGIHADLVAVDYDPDGVDGTNLNRYTLFDRADLGHPKATRAALRLAGSGVKVTPRDQTWQAWTAKHPDEERELVLSCVDNNDARHAIQSTMPGVILSSSTSELSVQVIAFERRPGEACLRCRNAVKAMSSDDAVITRLRSHDATQRARLAEQQGVNPIDLERYLNDPQANCGLISGATLQRFASDAEPARAWSVGFVSAMAGILLAAEYLRRSMGQPSPRLSSERNMARFQFWHPGAAVNSVNHWPPAAGCLCATPVYLKAVLAHPVSIEPLA